MKLNASANRPAKRRVKKSKMNEDVLITQFVNETNYVVFFFICFVVRAKRIAVMLFRLFPYVIMFTTRGAAESGHFLCCCCCSWDDISMQS
jgi:hypothetical protein